ncbi:MAG: GAF domain-containing protein [Proteobacteria bacterium]|nr:MAG: GAF domain-containing protein [Pseudomonadota bacterium]
MSCGNPTTALSTPEAFQSFRRAFDTRGLRAALGELLALSDYRFIGLWRFQDGLAAAAVHVDRDDPLNARAAEVPETATYCTFVRDSGSPFSTADATADPRLQKHPARDVVRTYCGVPLMDSEGEVLGTLCHYDLVPRDPEQINVELMLMVSSFLSLNRHIPPYPAA